MNYVVDRIEGKYAVLFPLDEGKPKKLLLSKLPQDVEEGAVLTSSDKYFYFEFNEAETNARKKAIQTKIEQVFKQ